MNTNLFNDFLQVIKPTEIPLVMQINDVFIDGGCTQTVKESASGFTVSYLDKGKKTVANFVCRKAGVRIRITPKKPFVFDEVLKDLPENMKTDIIRANECKRLSDPSKCNPRCVMGYSFELDGQNYKKCRSMAFLFDVTEENFPCIIKFIKAMINKTLP